MKDKVQGVKYDKIRRYEAVQRLNKIYKNQKRFNFIRQVFFSHKGNKNMEFI